MGNVNFFMNVPIDADGSLGIVDRLSAPGKRLALRADADTLVLISNCPQINNPCNGFDPTAIRLIITVPGSCVTVTTCEVLRAGPMTTVQDWPGRLGYWKVGVPPSGPMDDLSFRLANLAVGSEGAAGLEATLAGPSLRFGEAVVVAVTGPLQFEVTIAESRAAMGSAARRRG